MHHREYIQADEKRPLRHAVEIRHKSFEVPAFIALLRQYQVALVIADTAGKWPDKEAITADFTYLRLHGAEELYASGYTDKALDDWAVRIEAWSRGGQPEDAKLISSEAPSTRQSRDVYCYFDNDIKVRAPFDARKLLKRLNLESGLSELDWTHADAPGEFNTTSAGPGKARKTILRDTDDLEIFFKCQCEFLQRIVHLIQMLVTV